jgi:glycosyltransferase involved in cell wall biosynthesis
MNSPLVSLIVTTRNNAGTLRACLSSLTRQTYPHTEIIVVDNASTDQTRAIAKSYTKKVFERGPERSAQRNFGVSRAAGDYVFIIDSDMQLTPKVVEACVQTAQAPDAKAIIIPEESIGEGFWAKCKRLERSYYVGNDAIEAARFFDKQLYQAIGGYNEAMTGGEDWDITKRARAVDELGRIDEYILHDEGRLHFTRTMRKMYYYASHASAYLNANPDTAILTDQSGPLARYKLFFSKPVKLFRNPVVGTGMLLLKTSEYVSGGAGLLMSRMKKGDTTV